MPVYEYYCKHCQREFEVKQSMRERDKGSTRCPKCNSREQVEPELSVFFARGARKS